MDVVVTACDDADESHLHYMLAISALAIVMAICIHPIYKGLNSFYNMALPSHFMEFWLHDELVMVAVCDQLDDGISAVYTFYDPDATINSLGTLAILSPNWLC